VTLRFGGLHSELSRSQGLLYGRPELAAPHTFSSTRAGGLDELSCSRLGLKCEAVQVVRCVGIRSVTVNADVSEKTQSDIRSGWLPWCKENSSYLLTKSMPVKIRLPRCDCGNLSMSLLHLFSFPSVSVHRQGQGK
jgi:hypothetical protein